MRYRKGYKYQLDQAVMSVTRFRPTQKIDTDYMTLSTNGQLVQHKGYAWDGGSGPAIDTPLMVRLSCPHDGLYQLIRMGLLSFADWRLADQVFPDNIQAYMARMNKVHKAFWQARLKWIDAGLYLAQGIAADPTNRRKVFEVLP